MDAIIVIPRGNKRLDQIASLIKTRLDGKFASKKTDIVPIDSLKPEDFLSHDIVIIGNPTIKYDIHWPIQVAVDGYMHKILKEDFSKIIVSAFTIWDTPEDAERTLNAILWTFRETSARVVDGLYLLNSDSKEIWERKIAEFVARLKKN